MRVLTGATLLVTALALTPAVAPAQSLGEAAAREKERKAKETKKPPAKVYTESDLGAGSGPGTVSQLGSTTPTSSPDTKASPGTGGEGSETKAEKTEEELKAEQEKAWRDRRNNLQAEIARLTEVTNRLQTNLNDLSGPLYGGTRTSLLSQLEKAKSSLAEAQKMLGDLEEEGRRAGYR